jgi:peptide/nickel transport system permease protein
MSLLRRLASEPVGLAGLALVGGVVVLALLAPWIAPYDPLAIDLAAKLAPPSARHWMGTDQAGRDILSRILWGARPSLTVGVLAVLIGAAGGVAVGLTAAYLGGWWEALAMRIVDGLAAIPLLVWAIALVGIVGVGPVAVAGFRFPNESKIVLLVGILYIPPLARVTYAAALSQAKLDYVKARRMQGASAPAIMAGDVLPNCLSPVIVQGTLLIAVGIVVEASLSFVGLGVEPPAPSWGSMLADARNSVFSGEWWSPVFPGLAISLSVIGFNLLGDAMRDGLDPRLTRGGTALAGPAG